MNVNNWGVIFYFGTDFDLSSNSSLTLTFTKPNGATLVVTSPQVYIRNAQQGPFAPNTYAIYTFQEGDVDQAGEWSARLTYDATGQQLTSDLVEAATFVVGL
jgi:hypothetical protein